jgi:hypothetical protein
MSENASGQLLGYTIQYPRALCHLLRAAPGDAVCIEVHGDVATIHSDGTIEAEEDKSSINSNPVTDKSSDLWKTLYNWVISINNNELNPQKTTFILYRNKSGREGIVNYFDKAVTRADAQTAIDNAKKKIGEIKEDHAIWSYYKCVIFDYPERLIDVIVNFRLETGFGAGFHDVEAEVRAKLVPANQVPFLASSISGWLVRKIAECISANQQAKITWEDFDSAFTNLFCRVRRLELIDFTLDAPPSNFDIDSHLALRPIYLRQVELVNGAEDELIEAVTNFLRAKINRDKWIEADVIDERLASDFENKLLSYWKNTKVRIGITNRGLSNEDLGKLLLVDCMVRSETIQGESLPASTIAGTYHALANEPIIGWHPEWPSKFKK